MPSSAADCAPEAFCSSGCRDGDAVVRASVARALKESFPYVRVFRSVEGWGYHFLASDRALRDPTAAELAQRLPVKAASDLVEWGPEKTPERQFAAVLKEKFHSTR